MRRRVQAACDRLCRWAVLRGREGGEEEEEPVEALMALAGQEVARLTHAQWAVLLLADDEQESSSQQQQHEEEEQLGGQWLWTGAEASEAQQRLRQELRAAVGPAALSEEGRGLFRVRTHVLMKAAQEASSGLGLLPLERQQDDDEEGEGRRSLVGMVVWKAAASSSVRQQEEQQEMELAGLGPVLASLVVAVGQADALAVRRQEGRQAAALEREVQVLRQALALAEERDARHVGALSEHERAARALREELRELQDDQAARLEQQRQETTAWQQQVRDLPPALLGRQTPHDLHA